MGTRDLPPAAYAISTGSPTSIVVKTGTEEPHQFDFHNLKGGLPAAGVTTSFFLPERHIYSMSPSKKRV